MWSALPKKILIYVSVIWYFLVFSILLYITQGDDAAVTINQGNLLRVIGLLSMTITIGTGILLVIGKWGWRSIWRISWATQYLNREVCPDLNGTWKVELESSYTDEVGNKLRPTATAEIKMDFFNFRMTLKSNNSSLTSEVVVSKIVRNEETKRFHLSYMFHAINKKLDKKQTDADEFDGSAKLNISFEDNLKIEMNGVYWTNRKYEENMQTAGDIRFRPADSP